MQQFIMFWTLLTLKIPSIYLNKIPDINQIYIIIKKYNNNKPLLLEFINITVLHVHNFAGDMKNNIISYNIYKHLAKSIRLIEKNSDQHGGTSFANY